ncbi:CDP-diacylglycerol--glycerol-3-phosphate 3-phosphatidyltransferase, mitochondrial [Nymphon striatum]|nr:CDP-diacylglycerol--glycerol-3-phosphate 3-phosphatidyltransferase, mitochondrial [Nymphon striatum]
MMHRLMCCQSHLLKYITVKKICSMSFQLVPSFSYSIHAQNLPKFKINGENVHVLHSPTEFYNRLLELSKNAKKRIVVSSLYLGTGPMEKNLVNSWQEAALKSKDLKLHVLLDYNRGSRGVDNSRTMLLSLMKTMKENMQVSLYHTPYLRGFLRFLLPNRWNELVGLNHMKIYLFDDSVIMSGANLSDQYFVNRQDRYMLFKDCTQMADFFHDLVKTVSTFSFQLQIDNSVKLHPSWKFHPFKDNLEDFKIASKSLMSNLLLKWSSVNNVTDQLETDTIVYPQLQMGELDVDHDVLLTNDLFKSAIYGSVIKLSTGYFNLHPVYKESLINQSKANFLILMSSPQPIIKAALFARGFNWLPALCLGSGCISVSSSKLESAVKVGVSSLLSSVIVAEVSSFDLINYGNKGWKPLENHVGTKKHIAIMLTRRSNYAISTPGHSTTTTTTYGLHPMFQNSENHLNRPMSAAPIIPLNDRIANAQAMVLGVIAEHSLPLSMAPVLIGLSKKLAKDSKALTKLSLDRTTAAYKLRFGLADTMLARTIENIKQVPFSLNMDESTSKNLLRVFTILVSYYSDSSHEVVVEHLASVSLIKVASAPLFEQITGLFDKYNLPWENLMSVLMDSCNVMRGSKTGLEVRLREKASHLLDIDGDSCHHIHNCSKKFCEPFEKAVEKLHTDIYNDFKWSADLMDALKEICMILEVKFTKPDRFLGHRWLSCYDVTLANLRLMDAYLMFYYSFIPKESKPLYHHVVVSIFHSKEASNQSRMRIRVIQEELSRKSLTEDGRKRKNRIVEKLQAELFQEFLGLFIKPEELEHKTLKQLKEMDIDKADLLSKKSMFIGFSTEKALQQLDEISAGQFLTKAQTAFKACAGYMQKKLPLTNATLRRLSAIDPTAVGHSLTLLHLKKLPKTFPTVLNMSERQSYDREVHAFQLDCNLPPAYHLDETPVQLDHWWRDVIKMGKYPALTKMAKAIMSCFHGPLVESSFNLMQDILDTRSGRMKIETFNAFQTVKYSITAQKKSSLELFDRQDILRDPVNTTLCNNLQESWKRYKEEKENKRKVIEQKKAAYALKAAKLESKQKSKVAQQLVEKKARMAFIQKRQNNLKRKANLEALANGFFGASGMSRAIPSAYTYLAHTFYNKIKKQVQRNQSIQLHEYSRDGWTFHAKGLWYYQPNSSTPNISLIGSPNFGMLLYGAETWTLNEAMEKRIRSLEMWFYRRILKIVWTDKISNKEVIKRIVDGGGWQLEIMKDIKRRKMLYCGHIIRAEGLQSNIMLGRLEGYRSVTRDLECQLCLMTNNTALKHQLHQEQQVLFELSYKMTAEKYAKETIPLWVKLVTYFCPSLF